MSCDIVLGGQWGDEGKAKIIDFLSKDYDIICRFQGGANAGHTVVAGGKKFVFHLIPSGILYPGKICVLGNGLVIDLSSLTDEIKYLESQNISFSDRLKISTLAHVVLPYHILLDKARENKSSNKIGTTHRGIGPAYTDKFLRCGIRIADLLNPDKLEEKIKESIYEKKVLFQNAYSGQSIPEPSVVCETILKLFEPLKKYAIHTPYFLNTSIRQNKSVLMEGAQGAGLDIDFGSYPYVTSSNTTCGGAVTGSGVGLKNFSNITGVFKAYITRVGGGRLPTALEENDMKVLREAGGEYGATTGRPRNCGWFDGVQAKYAVIINSLTQIALTKIDIFDQYKKIYFCRAYKINGTEKTFFPANIDRLSQGSAVYETVPGWDEEITGVNDFHDLPTNAQKYICRIEEEIGKPITIIGVGPKRSQTIFR